MDNSRFVGSQVSHVFVLCVCVCTCVVGLVLLFFDAPFSVSHVLFLFFGCGLKRDLCCCCLCGGFGLSLFFVAPFSLLAVFKSASAFNQDVSTWNTGAVTTMASSKCTLSPSLWPRFPLWCVVECIRQLEVRRVTSLTRVVLVFVCGLKRYLLLLFVWWVWSFSFLCCTLLFLQCFMRHLCSIRMCPTGIRVR